MIMATPIGINLLFFFDVPLLKDFADVFLGQYQQIVDILYSIFSSHNMTTHRQGPV